MNDGMKEIVIGNKIIGGNNPVYIIAEIGLNHQGDVKLAKKMIDIAHEAGCDCVKFQKRSLKKVYTKEALQKTEKEEQGTGYIMGHLKKNELSNAEMKDLYSYTTKKEMNFMCSPWDEESLNFLAGMNVNAYKVASAEMFNLKFIQQIARFNKPTFISTGMSFLSEIEQLVKFLNKINAKYILLHCNSTYPAPHQDINLNFLKMMQSKFKCIVGYSGHESGITVSIAAVTMGAKVIEKHLTLDRNMPGPDHKASLEPKEFKELVKQIRIAESSLGEAVRYPSRGEYLNRETLSKSLVAASNLKKGKVLKFEDIAVKSPGKGVSPLNFDYFIGKKLSKRNIKKDDYILESDIDTSNNKVSPGILKLKHKWGVVGRMSDIDYLMHCKSNFVEIHPIDSDINLDKHYTKNYNIDLTMHGAEYERDLLLDLSSLDENVRKKSIAFFNKMLDYARSLKQLFKNRNETVKFVAHPGGMNIDAPLTDKIDQLNRNLHDSLSKLNADGFELLVENMPPLPWYFGGQWHHASFMDADEIVAFSKKTGFGVVFDISHAALYCNYYKKDLEEFTKKILPVTKHVHIADAARFNGEGLQIGDGTVDFKKILKHLAKTNLWFLVEIWQGHKFGGEGFMRGARNLKKISSDF